MGWCVSVAIPAIVRAIPAVVPAEGRARPGPRTLDVMVTSRAEHGVLLAEMRAGAVSRMESLAAAMAELRADRGVDTADDEHDPEGVTLSTEWARLAGLRVAAERELAEIDEALARWDAGTYGICIDCGRGIPIERLRARPAATRCVACAEKAGV